jgi:hypothetical protein
VDYGKLPFTGAGFAVGGIVFDQVRLVAIAVGIMVIGMLMVRFGWRRGQNISD